MTYEEFRTERTNIISKMLDNPDKYGIYPTTICFKEMDALFIRIEKEAIKKEREACLKIFEAYYELDYYTFRELEEAIRGRE